MSGCLIASRLVSAKHRVSGVPSTSTTDGVGGPSCGPGQRAGAGKVADLSVGPVLNVSEGRKRLARRRRRRAGSGLRAR